MTENVRFKEFGERVQTIRKKLGMNMRQFANAIDDKASAGTVSNWEYGKNMPNAQRIKRIAELGNVTIEYLEHGKIEINETKNMELLKMAVKEAKLKTDTTLIENLDDLNASDLSFVQKNLLNSVFAFMNDSTDLQIFHLNDIIQKLLKIDRLQMTPDELKELKFEVFKIIESIFDNK